MFLASAPFGRLDRLAADIARAGSDFGDLTGPDVTCIRERTILNSRTARLFPHGRLADE